MRPGIKQNLNFGNGPIMSTLISSKARIQNKSICSSAKGRRLMKRQSLGIYAVLFLVLTFFGSGCVVHRVGVDVDYHSRDFDDHWGHHYYHPADQYHPNGGYYDDNPRN